MRNRILSGIALLMVGLSALAITPDADANEARFNPGSVTRECESRIDTNCVHWLHGHPTAEGPVRVRYVDDAQFCVLVRPPRGNRLRCESYWPFRNPVIGSR